MARKCDHKSVGMLVWRNGSLLLIERKKPPFGFAPPAGHIDDDTSFEDAARRELKEEVGLDTRHIELVTEGRKENPCRREDGTWHYWKLYLVETAGEVKRSEDETKRAGFYTTDEMTSLAERTRTYLDGAIDQDEWEQSPGIEPVWYEWFREMNVI